MPSTHEIKRLVFSRYLWRLGQVQAKQPEPLAAASVLMFHDATELFLRVAAEHLSANHKQDDTILPLWAKVDEALQQATPSSALMNRGAVARVNDVRIALKHRGVVPGRREIEECETLTLQLLTDGVGAVFHTTLDSLSLVDFVVHEPTRDLLKAAEAGVTAGDFGKTGASAALAFKALMEDYEQQKIDGWFRSPFSLGERLRPPMSTIHRIRRRSSEALHGKQLPEIPEDFFKFFSGVNEAIEEIRGAIKVLAFGFDYRKYARFLLLTPEVSDTFDVQRHVDDKPIPQTREEAMFCVDFVLECALKLQDFDFRV